MAVGLFHLDAHGYGTLSSIIAVGTLTGALLDTGRMQPRFSLLLTREGNARLPPAVNLLSGRAQRSFSTDAA